MALVQDFGKCSASRDAFYTGMLPKVFEVVGNEV